MLKFKGEVLPKDEKVKKSEPKMHVIQKVLKGETFLVMAQATVELEDEFSSLYWTTSNQSNLFLQPPYEPNTLLNFTQTNNVLNQCIEALEVNIDGTGHAFIPAEKDKEIDPKEEAIAKGFFDEPYPNESFVKIRRKLRRQLEALGYAFLEVIRSMDGSIVSIRNIETHHVRFVKLDQPVQVQKTLTRNGKDVTFTLWERERRFAQRVALKTLVYYKEFGCSRDARRDNGNWAQDKEKIEPSNTATELLLFGIHPDITSPYFVPRWINELPSVVGSRSAEEQNLQFLDSGGMPPAIIFIQGGTITKDVSDQLNMYLSGQNKNKNRAVVVEAQSSSGALDSASRVDVKVERFGAEKAQDAMFMKYDAATEDHVRVGFRLPPLFLGKAADYNFATAQTSYMVAEAQVFAPERDAFDEVINKTIIKGLGLKTLKFKSNPITLKDITNQLKGMQLLKDVSTRESFLEEGNIALGTDLKLAAMPQPDTVTATAGGGAPPATGPTMSQVKPEELPASTQLAHMKPNVHTPEPPPDPTSEAMAQEKLKGQKIKNQQFWSKKKTAIELVELAHEYASIQGIVEKRDITPLQALKVQKEVDDLDKEDTIAFNRLLSAYAFGSDDPELVKVSQYANKHLQ